MAALPEAISYYLTSKDYAASVPRRVIDNTLVFSTSLINLSLNLSSEQMVTTYGSLMHKGFRKKIRAACKQIKSYKPEIETMRLLANPKCDSFENRSYVIYS